MTDLVKEVHLVCSAVLTKGTRKGLECGRKKNDPNELYCKNHADRLAEGRRCTEIVTKGERKNQTCNRKVVSFNEDNNLCKIHNNAKTNLPYNPYVKCEKEVFLRNNMLISDLGSIDMKDISESMVESIMTMLQ